MQWKNTFVETFKLIGASQMLKKRNLGKGRLRVFFCEAFPPYYGIGLTITKVYDSDFFFFFYFLYLTFVTEQDKKLSCNSPPKGYKYIFFGRNVFVMQMVNVGGSLEGKLQLPAARAVAIRYFIAKGFNSDKMHFL